MKKIEIHKKDSSDSEELTPPRLFYQQIKIYNNDLKDELLTLIKTIPHHFWKTVDLIAAMG